MKSEKCQHQPYHRAVVRDLLAVAVERPGVPLLLLFGLDALLARALAARTLPHVAAHELRLVAALEALLVEAPAAAEALPRRGLVVHQRELRVVVRREEVEDRGRPALAGVVAVAAVLAVPRLVPVRRCCSSARRREGEGKGRGVRGGRDRSGERGREGSAVLGRREKNGISHTRTGQPS